MSSRPAEILIVDDESEIGTMLTEALLSPDRQCTAVGSGEAALDLLCKHAFDVLISDISMPQMTGLELLAKTQQIRPECQTILITGVGTTAWAKDAIRRGAFDYIEKPFDLGALRNVVDAAIARRAERSREARGSEDGETWELADRDSLTGLANHRRLIEELARLRARCRRTNQPVSVLLVDVCAFRAINDEYGHARGDLLLREVGQRLRHTARESDVVARYGWDQFVLALPDAGASDAARVAQRCLHAVEGRSCTCGGQDICCRVSIGYAECESGFIETEMHLLRRAGDALVEAKSRGGGVAVNWLELARRGSAGLRADLPGLQAMRNEFLRIQEQLRQAYLESTRALVAAVEAKDPYTEKHSMTVAHYASSFAKHLGLPSVQVDAIRTAGILHDIGKIGIPDSILRVLVQPEMENQPS